MSCDELHKGWCGDVDAMCSAFFRVYGIYNGVLFGRKRSQSFRDYPNIDLRFLKGNRNEI